MEIDMKECGLMIKRKVLVNLSICRNDNATLENGLKVSQDVVPFIISRAFLVILEHFTQFLLLDWKILKKFWTLSVPFFTKQEQRDL